MERQDSGTLATRNMTIVDGLLDMGRIRITYDFTQSPY